MRRIISIRWWALALALTLSVSGIALAPHSVVAGGTGNQMGDPTGSFDGGEQPSTLVGDPDSPTNTGKPTRSLPVNGRAGLYSASRRGAGDASGESLVWMYRYRIALQLVRAFILRF